MLGQLHFSLSPATKNVLVIRLNVKVNTQRKHDVVTTSFPGRSFRSNTVQLYKKNKIVLIKISAIQCIQFCGVSLLFCCSSLLMSE